MKTKPNRILSIFMSMLMVFTCITSASVQAVVQKMILKFNTIDVSAGQDIQFDIITAGDVKAIKEITNAVITIPDGFTVTGMSDTSPAFNGTVTHSVSGNYLNFSIASNGTVGDSDVVASIYMHVNENCEQKNYMFQWTTNAVSCILADGSSYTPQFNFGIIRVGDTGSVQNTTTSATTSTTTTTTTTTTAKKYIYSINFVDEETNQGVSGVRYNIVSYYALDPAHVVQTSGENPKSFEFISDTAYVALTTLENALPDGYQTSDGAERWELSADNPNLTVYLRKAETTTTTTTTTTETTTMTTTNTSTTKIDIVSSELNISIKSYPKIAYKIGEKINLSGGQFSYSYKESYNDGTYTATTRAIDMKDSEYVDTSEFDSSKEGTYKIYVKFPYRNDYAETYFTVSVSETGDPIKHTYSVYFVDEETGQAVSGVQYGIASRYVYNGIDPALTVQTSGENPKSYEFISDTAYVQLEFPETTLPDGYYVADGTKRWELSGDNPNLIVYLRNSENISLGDINKDGQINAVDASIVSIEYALLSTGDHIGQFTDEQNTIADLNKDGKINAVDASLIAMYYAYLSTDNETGTKDSIDIWLSYSVTE
ncbi:MAG: hypothetical protein K2K66_01295 [Ruminococcus sp.]|nr:hypothetical protein [Ruminococcus sp.]